MKFDKATNSIKLSMVFDQMESTGKKCVMRTFQNEKFDIFSKFEILKDESWYSDQESFDNGKNSEQANKFDLSYLNQNAVLCKIREIL